MDEDLASDILALWQSELTAMAADRELRESWAAQLALWAAAVRAAAGTLRAPDEPAAGGAGAVQPAGAAPAGAASEPGNAEILRLGQRVAELERRLEQFSGH